ncbi:MAG: hypothetical protein ACRDSQ_23425 [Actinokineospora sp.]
MTVTVANRATIPRIDQAETTLVAPAVWTVAPVSPTTGRDLAVGAAHTSRVTAPITNPPASGVLTANRPGQGDPRARRWHRRHRRTPGMAAARPDVPGRSEPVLQVLHVLIALVTFEGVILAAVERLMDKRGRELPVPDLHDRVGGTRHDHEGLRPSEIDTELERRHLRDFLGFVQRHPVNAGQPDRGRVHRGRLTQRAGIGMIHDQRALDLRLLVPEPYHRWDLCGVTSLPGSGNEVRPAIRALKAGIGGTSRRGRRVRTVMLRVAVEIVLSDVERAEARPGR